MSRREKVLLNVLLWVVAAAILGVLAWLELEKSAETRGQAAVMEEQIRRFSERAGDETELEGRRQRLVQALEAERQRFYGAGEMDTYGFGIIIRDLLVAGGLEISRYQTVEVGQSTYLEFSVAGSALELARFLQRVSASEKYWSVPFLSISNRSADGNVQSVFRITYEKIDGLSR